MRRTGNRGITLDEGGSGNFVRVTVEDAHEGGVVAVGAPSLVLADATIRRTRALGDGMFGRAIVVQRSNAELTRVHVDEYDDIGVYVGEAEATVSLNDVFIEQGVGQPSDGLHGEGILVHDDGVLRGARVSVEGAREAGVLSGRGAVIELSALEVRGTLPRRCASSTCADSPMGFGLAAVDGALIVVDFASVDSSLCGLFISGTGTMDLAMGRVAGAEIGACLQAADFDVARITDGVAYEDNATNLSATTLPVPTPPDTIPSDM
ncbi:MAG: hypothetical protein JRH11_19310 [Deltaproteobacteria bacterium]|nr:hypothetical protein [Deltaproteobacteria bacterium]